MEEFERWSNIDSYSKTWEDRTRLMSSLIQPHCSVIEFGAGVNPISNYLPNNHCMITDFVNKPGFEFNYYDLNSDKLVDFGLYDYGVFSGVLEYIHRLPSKISYISNRCKIIITSYATSDEYPKNREKAGWVNSYSNTEFIEIFKGVGMKLDTYLHWNKIHSRLNKSDYMHSQHIYKFIKHDI